MKKFSASLICVVRNDNYGAHYEERLISFFKSIEYSPDGVDLILVEWNPPIEKKSFYEEYYEILPKNKKIKIVTVPNEIHSKISNGDKFPVFEYIGKNCGARFSDSEYLIFTNPDNIFPQSIWEEIKINTNETNFLRAKRTDLEFQPFDYKGGKIEDIIGGLKHLQTHSTAFGDLCVINKKLFYEIGGYEERTTYSHLDAMFLRELERRRTPCVWINTHLYHIEHSRPHLEFAMKNKLETSFDNTHKNGEEWGLIGQNIQVKPFYLHD